MRLVPILRRSAAAACLLLCVGSCEKQETVTGPGAVSKATVAGGGGKQASIAPVDVSGLPGLIERMTKDTGDETAFLQYKEAVKKHPRELLPLLLQLPEEKRFGLITVFFETLSLEDKALALELLPKSMSSREQMYWAKAVSSAYARSGDFTGTAAILNTRFPADARSTAIEEAIGMMGESVSAADALAFWEALNSHSGKDLCTGRFASWLAGKDPAGALKWYEGLDKRERRGALDSVIAQNSEQLLQQFGATSDEAIRSRVVQRMGYLAARQHGDIAAAMQNVPAERRAEMEVSYVHGLFSEEGGRNPNALALLKDYRPQAASQEAKDAADIIFAGQEFGRDPPKTIEILSRDGLGERNIEEWGSYMGRWLGVDSEAASKFIDGLPEGKLRTAGIEQLVSYLEDAGDKEKAAAWKKVLKAGKPN